MTLIPSHIGQQPLTGSYYTAECTICGWVGSSEVLTDDCQCTRDVGGQLCLGDTDEIGTGRLLEIVQGMATRHGEAHEAPALLAQSAELLTRLNTIIQGASDVNPLVKEIADAKVKGLIELFPEIT